MPPAGRAEGIPQIYHKNATIVENWEGILGQQHWVFYGPTLLTPSKSLNIDCHNRTFQAKLWWLKHPFYDTAHRPIYNIFFFQSRVDVISRFCWRWCGCSCSLRNNNYNIPKWAHYGPALLSGDQGGPPCQSNGSYFVKRWPQLRLAYDRRMCLHLLGGEELRSFLVSLIMDRILQA